MFTICHGAEYENIFKVEISTITYNKRFSHSTSGMRMGKMVHITFMGCTDVF
jgi:hypothetical protein